MAEAVQAEFLTVHELAELLRIKERKVYDLAASGEVPVARVTGKLLFPADEVREWIARGSSGGTSAEAAPRPPILLGSHDPLLDWAARASRCGLATLLGGSLDGLARFGRGEGTATGLHLFDPESGGWNVPAVRGTEGAVLVHWAVRRRGLVLRPEDAGAVRGLGDLAGRRVAPRQPEAGAQTLFEHLLDGAGVETGALRYAPAAQSEGDAVLAVAEGEADAAFGLEACARPYGLSFMPLVEERFDLLIDRRAFFEPPLQRLMAFARSPEFRDHAAGRAGYDASTNGEVVWNG